MAHEDIESALALPDAVVTPALDKVRAQDERRGAWLSPRDAAMPEPPWPDSHDPMLRFLLAKARASIDAGIQLDEALVQLASHAWFEGGIENYDRGQREARQPRSL